MTTKKLNILYHHRTQGRGAEGVHISSIVNALESMGHNVTVLSPPGVNPLDNAGNAPVDKSEVKTTGVNSLWKFISKSLPNFLFEIIEIIYNIPALGRLEKELSKSRYDLIYERYAFYLFAGALKSKKHNIPFVLEANEVNGIKERARKQSFPRLCNYFEKSIFKKSTSIHTVSSYLKNMIIHQGITQEKIIISPNAINPEKFGKKINNTELKKKLNLEDKFVIGFAGWFDEWDRLDLLIDVFNNLRNKHNNLALLLIGDGAVLENVRKKVLEFNLQNDVVLTGAVPRSEVHHYISMLDVSVITHSNEFGSPVVMFEFMGLKVPVVAPLLPPVTDVLTHGKDALLFDVLDMKGLEKQLDTLLRDETLQKNLANQAYNKLICEHTWLKNAENIVSSAGFK